MGKRDPGDGGGSLTVNRRELGTVLAALRFWQGHLIGDTTTYDCETIASDGGMKPLGADEIDRLIERINR